MSNIKNNFERLRIWLKYILLVYLGLLAIGFVYQSVANAYDLRRFPKPGKLVEIGEVKLHLYCTGQHVKGKPTVILEGGLGAPAFMWTLVQPEIAKHTRVCSYDRAGYAWSDASSMPRAANQIALELHQLLVESGEPAPYILIGHSFGGTIIRIYAAQYSVDVAGLILVDARHEDFFQRMPAEYLQGDKNNLQRAKTLSLITPFGITRQLGVMGQLKAFESYLAPLPDQAEEEAWALIINNPSHWSTAVAERESLLESYQQVRYAQLPGDMPVIVLTAENGFDAWRASGDSPSQAAIDIWMQMQKELSQLSSQGQWIIVKDSGHYIYFDQPASIVDAVLELLKK